MGTMNNVYKAKHDDDDDDDEALPQGVVDVRHFRSQEKKELLQRLVNVVENDNHKLLSNIKARMDRVGIELPNIEVRFEDLNVETRVLVPSRALPSFNNFFLNILEGFGSYLGFTPSRKRHLKILDNVSGILKPGRMSLLLGPPSSGKTTLLLALAGKLDPTLKFSGRVTYNGYGMEEFVPQRTAAYISQDDTHIGEMTVRETLAFSARCQGVGNNPEIMAELLRREKEANIKPDPDLDIYMKMAAMEGQEASVYIDYIIKILGLENCADTMVGDGMSRGISGGEKRRVTTGEMLVGPVKAFFMDGISTGLDSSTTFQVVSSISDFVHILNGTALISLLQPEPETFDLFDDIILISQGHLVYQGPRQHVLHFFESMGFKCPDRKAVPDFLQEITSKKEQRQYWARHDQPYRYIRVAEFAEAFRSSEMGRGLIEELQVPFDRSQSHPFALATKKYGVSVMDLLRACAMREILLIRRNSFVYIFRIIRIGLMGLVAMTIFFRTEFHQNIEDGSILVGALYIAVTTTMYGGISDISLTIQKLPVFYKQRDSLFYPAWAYGFPSWITRIPPQFLEIAAYSPLIYYVIGYDPNIGRFLKQYLLLFVELQAASSAFRLIASVGRDMIVSNTIGFLFLLVNTALCGYVLSRESVKKWWLWGFYSFPLMYAQNAILVNEFTGHKWSHVSSSTNITMGVQILKSRGFFTEPNWYWIGLGALCGMVIIYFLGYILALTFLNPLRNPQGLSLEDDNENNETLDQNKDKKHLLPFEPHTIIFDEISYSVDMPQEMKDHGGNGDRRVLLKGVSGAFRPGVLSALMGVSGAGKTTLLDILAGRKTGGYIEGTIKISGYPKKQETFARICGYCEQNDVQSPYITVYESLLFSAWLRLPRDVDSESRKMLVEVVMDLVELSPLRRGLVGLPGVSGLSAEQRKRLTIAVELVANPSIIFMDEPTSGLDARAAAIVMRTVRNTVDTGRTVVCTIHQPNIDIFEAFDELLLIKRGGKEIYFGPLGQHSCHMINYFEEIEGVPVIKNGQNPASWMLEVTSSDQEMKLGIDLAEIYTSSDLYRKNKALIDELSVPRPGMKDLHFETKCSQPLWTQFVACLWKQQWSYWRNPPYIIVRMVFTFFKSCFIGSIFWGIGSRKVSENDIFNAVGSMYSSILLLGQQSATSVQPVVATERAVSYRERAAGMYSALPFAFAQVAVEIPYIFAQTILYGPIVYAMVGFEWTATKFLWYLYVMFFTISYFTFYGMMTTSMTSNLQLSTIVSITAYSFWNILSGFVIPRPRTPVWWRWSHWACPVAWTLYGLAISQYGDVRDVLDTKKSVRDYLNSYFGYKHDFMGVVAIVLFGFALFFAFMFAFFINVFNFQRR